jgi:hypothetical protein
MQRTLSYEHFKAFMKCVSHALQYNMKSILQSKGRTVSVTVEIISSNPGKYDDILAEIITNLSKLELDW